MPTRWDVTRAVRESDLPAPARLVMFVLADRADVEIPVIPERWTPSLADLERETGLGRSTIARHLALLEEAGWVVRERPDAAAQVRGEKTRYRLTVPGVSADQTLVPERDQPSVTAGLAWSQSGTSWSQSGTSLVPERDQASPRAGHLYKEPKPLPDQSDLIGPPPTAAGANGSAEKPETAQTILAAFIDYCTDNGVQIPTRLKGHYAKEIKSALDGKIDPKIIRKALHSMYRDRVVNRPSLLPNRIVEVQTGPERRRSGQPNVYRNPTDQSAYDAWETRSWNKRT